MATTPDLQEPQIAAARSAAWHQAGDPLLTLEAARTWLEECGLLLFAPRALGAPAPSLVEATLGAEKPAITPAEADTARSLVARMVAEGSAIPLNLLGTPGDLPDFVVSAAAFPFVFTLRGDKGWKRPPETSGAVKVSPLGLRVYELLSERGAMTVADIVTEAGREVTESAIARALSELWSLLRVIPALQQGEGETLWELTTARFSKAVKAGANAGQPTALSALVSLYLGQVYIGSEEEIAAFLSPLTARSRVREVLHGLVAGRQLNEAVLDGKAVLYIPDALPQFVAVADPETNSEAAEADGISVQAGTEVPVAGNERISRFSAGSGGRAAKGDLRGKPVRREGGNARRTFGGPRSGARDGARRPAGRSAGGPPSRGPAERGDRPDRRPAAGSDRPRPAGRPSGDRPRPAGDRPPRPSFSRPWEEDRGSRPPRAEAAGDRPARPSRPRDDARPPRQGGGFASSDRPARPRDDARPPREGSSFRPARFDGPARPARSGDDARPLRREGAGERRPYTPRTGDDARPPRREGGAERRPYTPRAGAGGARDASGRPPFRRKDENGVDKPFRPRPTRAAGEGSSYRGGGEGRPAPRGDRPYRPRPEGDAGRPYTPRPYTPRPRTEEGIGGDRPRPSRPFGDRPPSRGPAGAGFNRGSDRGPGRAPGSDSDFRPKFGSAPGRPPFRPRPGGDRPAGDRPARSGGSASGRPPFRGGGDRPSFRPGGPPRGGGGGFSRGPASGPRKPGGPRAGGPARPPRGPRPEDAA